jgi:hypothetical protein
MHVTLALDKTAKHCCTLYLNDDLKCTRLNFLSPMIQEIKYCIENCICHMVTYQEHDHVS